MILHFNSFIRIVCISWTNKELNKSIQPSLRVSELSVWYTLACSKFTLNVDLKILCLLQRKVFFYPSCSDVAENKPL